MSSAGMLARDLGIAALSVRLSVTSWYRVKTNAAWIMLFSLPGSQPKNSSFFRQTFIPQLTGKHPLMRASNQGWKKPRFFGNFF